jgi:hypothetical protein
MTIQRFVIFIPGLQAMHEGKHSRCPSLGEEGHYLFGIEWPVQLCRIIAAPQHRNDQSVPLEQRLVIGDIDQLDQQAVFNKGHQHGFGHFAQVAPDGTEELAFRQHGGQDPIWL